MLAPLPSLFLTLLLIQHSLGYSRSPRARIYTHPARLGKSLTTRVWSRQEPLEREVRTIDILKFSLPTLAIWLSSPILSLIDTSVVGLRSSIELAALSPAVQICDSSLYMFNFLAVATTNLLAQYGGQHNDETESILGRAISIAVMSGLGLLIVIQAGAPLFLRRIAGKHTPQVIAPALRFARIRILGAPFCLLDSIAKSGCLAYRDLRTPLASTLAASLCNAIGDWYFVMVAGWGIFGAGLATALSEVVSSCILLRAIFRKNMRLRARSAAEVLRSMLVVPSLTRFREFWQFAGPICIAMVGKTVSYSFMTMFATSCGVIPLAAHQVMLRIFFFFTCFGDALSQTVQNFLPSLLTPSASEEQFHPGQSEENIPKAVTQFLRKIFTIGLAMGLALAAVSLLAPVHLPSLFSSDPLVWLKMKSIGPFLSASLSMHVRILSFHDV